jgi:hypothetical protein
MLKKILFLSVIYGFSYRARLFVRLGWKSLQLIKHYSLLRKFVNYGQKIYNIGPRMTIVSDATTWSVTCERHSDNSTGVIYVRNIFITQAPGSKKNGKKPFVLVALKQRSPQTRVTRSLKKIAQFSEM